MRARTEPWGNLTGAAQTGCAELWNRVWPSPTSLSLEERAHRYAQLNGLLLHLGVDGDEVVSVARTFIQEVSIEGQLRTVIALSGVCSHPDRRGEGWGDLVVRAAFERVEREAIPALFQTEVPAFYERLGSRVVPNRVVTSLEGAKPFDDPYVLIHPGDATWPDDAEVDLRVAGW